MRRLNEGVSIDEAGILVRNAREERAREKAPKTNPFKFKDPNAQRLSDLWFGQRSSTSIEQKDKVGLTYISKFLGLGEDAARKFTEGDFSTYHQVGLKQSAIPSDTDPTDFWREVDQIFPNTYRESDTAFLIGSGGVGGVLHFINQLEIPLDWESPVLRSLAINAHGYK